MLEVGGITLPYFRLERLREQSCYCIFCKCTLLYSYCMIYKLWFFLPGFFLSTCWQRLHLVYFCVLNTVFDKIGAECVTILVGVESYVLPVKNFSWRWAESLYFTNALGELEMLLSFSPCFSSVNLKYAPLSLCLKQNLLKILFLPFLPPPLQTIWLESRLLILDSGLENSNHSFSQLTEFICF